MKKTIKRQLWLVVWRTYDGKIDFVRHQHKGIESVFCSDKKSEAIKKLKSVRYDPSAQIISAKVTRLPKSAQRT